MKNIRIRELSVWSFRKPYPRGRKKGHTMSVACREMEKMILSVSE